MYVEDHDTKTLRLAKRKAYGACDKHSDHWDWGIFMAGIVPMGFLCFLVSSIAYERGLIKNIEPKIVYQYASSTLQVEQQIHNVCKNKLGELVLDQIVYLHDLSLTNTGYHTCTISLK